MLLSVIVPARDEEDSVAVMIGSTVEVLDREKIPFEIIIVDDGSQDRTASVVRGLSADDRRIRLAHCFEPHGFGMAVRKGLQIFRGDVAAVMMADLSDDPEDLVRCYRKLGEGYDCVFGSRFQPESKLIDYPAHKLLINRLANWFIKVLFRIPFNDTTNAFKLYRRSAVDAMQPLISRHFNLTVEMPLKVIVRGYSFAMIPISWRNRTSGLSKLKIKEMGSRYLFITLYLWLEKHLSRGDYVRQDAATPGSSASSRTHAVDERPVK
jgi:dolichol-phosphate mannosyltransferase